MELMILFGFFDDIAESEMTKKVKSDLTGSWHFILQKIVSVFNDMVLGVMKSFSPDMRTFLTALGYSGDASGFAGVIWTQSQDSSLNIFAIFAIIGYLLAITILVISLVKSALANVVDSKEGTVTLLIRFFITIILVTYSNSIIGLLLDGGCALWDKIYDLADSSTLTFTLGDDGTATLGTADSSSLIDISSLNGLLACILLIIITVEFFKMIFEIVGKYIILGMLYVAFPAAAGTFVSRTTSGILQRYIRMMLAQMFLLLMNVWCASMLIRMFLNIGGAQSDALFECLTVIAFERFAQKIDSYMKNMGLNNAVTGANLMDQIRSSASNLLAAPGNIAAAVSSVNQTVSAPSKDVFYTALSHDNFDLANKAAPFIMDPVARDKAMRDMMNRASKVTLTPDEIASMKIDGAVLGSMGNGFTAETIASAIEAAGGQAIRDALFDQYGINAAEDLSFDNFAKWDAKNGAWVFGAKAGTFGDQNIGFMITPSDNSPIGQKPLTSFTDSSGKTWNVFGSMPQNANSNSSARSAQGAAERAKKSAEYGNAHNNASGKYNGAGANGDNTAKTGAGGETGTGFACAGYARTDHTVPNGTPYGAHYGFGPDAMDSQGYIRNPFVAAQMTGIPNQYGLKANPDGTYSKLTSTGTVGSERYVLNNYDHSYTKVHDSNFIASAVGFGSSTYNEKPMSSFVDANGNIANPTIAKAFTGINSKNGLHVTENSYGTTVFEPIDQNGNVVTGKTVAAGSVNSAIFDADSAYKDCEEGMVPYLSAEDAANMGIEDAEHGVGINKDGTYSYINEDDTMDGDTRYLFGVENPYGVESLGDNNFRILSQDDISDMEGVKDQDSDKDTDQKADQDTDRYDQNDTINSENDNVQFDVADEDDIDTDYDKYSSLAGAVIHVNDDGSYSVLDDNGNAEDNLYHLPGEDSDTEFYKDENGDFHERLVQEASSTTMELHDLAGDGNGGYTGTMTMHNLYANSDDDADLEVRVANFDTRQGDEQVVSTFTDPDSGEEMAVFASDESIAKLVQDSAGKDIDNEQIGNAMLGLDHEKVQNEAAEYTENDNPIGNVTHVDESGTTVSRMDSQYSSVVRRKRVAAKKAAAQKNKKAKPGKKALSKKRVAKQNAAAKKTRRIHSVLSTKYSKGKRAYHYGWGPAGRSSMFKTPEKFSSAFKGQLPKEETVTSVTPLKGKTNATDYVVWTENKTTGILTKRTYTNVANIDPGRPFDRKRDSVLHFRKEKWIQTKVEVRS